VVHVDVVAVDVAVDVEFDVDVVDAENPEKNYRTLNSLIGIMSSSKLKILGV